MSEQKEKTVSIFDPTVNAYREVPLSLAKQFLDGVDELKQRIEDAEKEVAKEEAYLNSLKNKKDGKK